MCGIAGIYDRSASASPEFLERIAGAMGTALLHRGPDDGGTWHDARTGVALAHRRLSIVDLSPLGHQPMASRSGRYTIAYNGEVYNFRELRSELTAAGHTFRGHSDTEVILAGFEAWGIEAATKRMIGMFAIALWDSENRDLYLIRDRLGIKPIYWAMFGEVLAFGSELKALRVCPGWTPEIDRDALAAYMRHNYIPAPHTIYKGVHKLQQGHILRIPKSGEPQETVFWSLQDVAATGLGSRLDALQDGEATDLLEDLLKDAVGKRMVADVPLGAFLSGGIDSSLVVALMQAQSTQRVRTFSIGFEEAGYNEAHHAKAIAGHLGTEHTELYVTPQQAMAVIPEIPRWFDEPFADSSQIPTFLVSQMTRRHVTVALSGDGGDELFAGYNRYTLANAIWQKLARLPDPLRTACSAMLRSLSPQAWDRVFRFVPRPIWRPQAGDKLWKLAAVLDETGDGIYRRLLTHWDAGDNVLLGGTEPKGVLWDASVAQRVPDFVERMQYLDTITYLPDDILTKVDRASMAVALEARVPLIDHRVVELSWRLPGRFKIRNGQTKWLLRQVLYRHVPASLVERPKMGFGVPLDSWLRGPLRDWAEALLSEDRLRRDGLFNPAPIRRKWEEHLAGQHNWQYLLWDVLMVQAWLDMHWQAPGQAGGAVTA